jgi:nitric oxide reductase NorD protein
MTDKRDTILIDRTLEQLPTTIADKLRAVMPLVPGSVHNRLIDLVGEVCSLSCPAALEFLKSCPFVTNRVGPAGLESWFQEGLESLRKSEQSGIEYFRLGTFRSNRLLEELSRGVELGSIKRLMETYCLALTGSKVPVLPAELIIDHHAILLPDFVDRYPSKAENFAWYKVVATHQIGHFEFGSYEFNIDEATSLCRDLRFSHRPVEGDDTKTDIRRFVNLFDNSRLATDIFTTVEDSRIDFLTKQRYRGIRQDFSRIQAEALSMRPPITSHSLREAFLEILVRLSLESSGKWLVPAILHTPLHLASRIMSCVMSPEASIGDTTGATVRLYQLASRIPANRSRIDRWEAIEFNSSGYKSSTSTMSDIDEVLGELQWDVIDASPHFSPVKVEYRGIFRLEPVYKTSESEPVDVEEEETDYSHSSRQASTEMTRIDDIVDIGELAAESDSPEETHVFGMNRMDEDTPLNEAQPEQDDNDSSEEGPLEVNSPLSYLYDEWDFRASDYRLRWCRVREMPLAEGTPDFFEATLDEYARLVAQIRGRFEQLNPRSLRKVKRLHDGEDFDFDALVDFVIGKKAGQSSDAKIYWRRNKTERDVSVAFLLDMSSSTIEYINRLQKDSIYPVFARDYFEWLQSDHKGKLRPKEFKRIIDLEKESIVLVIRALEAIGDSYGIYGFSGHGRENVEFYVVKDLEEDFSDRVKSRIDSILPQQGTRMGPAIRHATWKLEQQEAKGKFLFLISDGRPEDHSYGREGLETDYAIHDTKMALLEARQKGITSLCLTFDRAGHDYLRTIAGDMQYEVLADIESLPACLPTLYGWVTT